MELFISQNFLLFSLSISNTHALLHPRAVLAWRVSGSILTLIGCYSSGWQTASIWGCESGQIQSTVRLDSLPSSLALGEGRSGQEYVGPTNQSVGHAAHWSDTHSFGPRSIFTSFGRWQNRLLPPPPTPPAQNNNKFRDSDPARQVRYEPKREASVESAQVRINSALLLSRLYVWVDIMASRVVEELVAGEVPT